MLYYDELCCLNLGKGKGSSPALIKIQSECPGGDRTVLTSSSDQEIPHFTTDLTWVLFVEGAIFWLLNGVSNCTVAARAKEFKTHTYAFIHHSNANINWPENLIKPSRT